MANVIDSIMNQLQYTYDRLAKLENILARLGICPECGGHATIPEDDYLCEICRDEKSR